MSIFYNSAWTWNAENVRRARKKKGGLPREGRSA